VSTIQYFFEQPLPSEIPRSCRNPFDNDPHPLAIKAGKELQQQLTDNPFLSTHLFDRHNGKMFGVLVVEDNDGRIGYLSSFSGMLNKQWIVPGFVPPVFNVKRQQLFLDAGEIEVTRLTTKIEFLSNAAERLQAIEKLSQLKRHQEMDVERLIKLNKVNKQQRRLKRSLLKNDQHTNKYLAELSFLSQQDKRAFKQSKLSWANTLQKAAVKFESDFEDEINKLIDKRKALSQELHKKVFENYLLVNESAEQKSLLSFFGGKIPPGGSGDCAAPKLIQFAHLNKLKILAMAEFWWGSSPAKGVRHHAHFYPPCRGKCHPVLPFMLQGVCQERVAVDDRVQALEPEIIYEDASLVVLNKPAGMLSIPGKQQQYSVLSWLQQRYPQASGALLVHRLDMATSGLLLAAKNAQVYKHLQHQFINRSVKKRYVALLSGKLEKQDKRVNLPLRVDLDDRPRQVVCYEYGKNAVTRVKVISVEAGTSRVYFYPLTGRTHQLRVHAAHHQGLDAPIVGDELYGSRSERLFLHAEKIGFEHPQTGEKMEFSAKTPF